MLISILLSILLVGASHCYVSYQPEQVHLSYGDNPWEIVVTWSTLNDTRVSYVEYGINGLVLKAKSKPKLFVGGGPGKRAQYIHRVKLRELTPENKYVYHCGSGHGWSDMFWFTTPPSDPWAPQVAMFGDMGNENAKSLSRLQEETQRGMYDAIVHVGDFAYDMDMEDGRVGDEFLRQLQPVAAYLPYMTCPGNHEEAYNFSDYRNRFTMPGGKTGQLMYSFNMGPVHFISISTEVYYFMKYGIKELVTQYDWLEQDLKEATSPANRTLHPWIILFGHRPMYCSNERLIDCSSPDDRLRIGIPFLHFFGLEKLLYDYGVDMFVWAHEHSYERSWPLYDYKIYNGSYDEPYRNPKAPIHITTGSAGCKEGREPFLEARPPWSAFRSNDYGYTRLQAHNASHLHLEQVSVDKDGAVIDQLWIIKDTHGPYGK